MDGLVFLRPHSVARLRAALSKSRKVARGSKSTNRTVPVNNVVITTNVPTVNICAGEWAIALASAPMVNSSKGRRRIAFSECPYGVTNSQMLVGANTTHRALSAAEVVRSNCDRFSHIPVAIAAMAPTAAATRLNAEVTPYALKS